MRAVCVKNGSNMAIDVILVSTMRSFQFYLMALAIFFIFIILSIDVPRLAATININNASPISATHFQQFSVSVIFLHFRAVCTNKAVSSVI
jgi:hypothetical protein